MPGLNPLAIFAPRLNHIGLRWMAVGSIASSAYGEYRVTNDIDVIVVLALAVTVVDLAMIEREVAARGLAQAWAACSRTK